MSVVTVAKESIAASSLNNGHTVVGTARVQLTALDFKAYKGVLMRAPGSTDPTPNTAPIWVGGPGVTADSGNAGGIPILPGDAIFIPIERPDKLYVISTAVDQDIAWLCM